MSRESPIVPILLVSTTIALGIGIILVSLYANRLRLERETLLSAAKFDGDALISRLNEMPATSIDFLEIDAGPDHPDLRKAREAWTTWKQSFSSSVTLAEIVGWHRSRLEPLGWKSVEGNDPDKATFFSDEWTLTILRLPDRKPPNTLHFQRHIQWRATL